VFGGGDRLGNGWRTRGAGCCWLGGPAAGDCHGLCGGVVQSEYGRLGSEERCGVGAVISTHSNVEGMAFK
jgi:hypothetical protein